MRSKNGVQVARFQVSTALSKEDYNIVNQTKDKHGVSLRDIINKGCLSFNSNINISENEIMRVVREGLKVLQHIPDDNKKDLTDTTPAPHQEL